MSLTELFQGLGQAVMANSLPVAIASDQTPVPANLAQVAGAAIGTGNPVPVNVVNQTSSQAATPSKYTSKGTAGGDTIVLVSGAKKVKSIVPFQVPVPAAPAVAYARLYDLNRTPVGDLGDAAALAIQDMAGGGSIASGTKYYYTVSKKTSNGGESPGVSNEVNATASTANDSFKLTWTNDPSATSGYNIYRSATSGGETGSSTLLASVAAGTTTYTDTGTSTGTGSAKGAGNDTTHDVPFHALPIPIGNGAGGMTNVCPADGIQVTNGLALRITGGSLYDGDTTAVQLNQVVVNYSYE